LNRRNVLLKEVQDAGFHGNGAHEQQFSVGPTANVLKNCILAMGNGFDVDKRSPHLAGRVSGKFTVGALLFAFKGKDFPFNHDFGSSRHAYIQGFGLDQFQWSTH
jgi:hypothetical protein